MRRLPRIVANLAYVMLACSFAGCATFHYPFDKRIPKATAGDPAVQILCLWQQAEGRDPDGYPCKGFSGQILFLSNKAATPVQIDGEVRIYLFDDQGTEEEQTKPIRQFDFDRGSWAIHLADSSLGPTYSVFVPYVRRGVKEANCALRLRLKPKVGPTIFSDLSNMPLNGNKKPLTGPEAKPLSPEEVDHDAADALSQKLHRTTTISMGPNPKTTESVPVAKKTPDSNRVTQASHQVGSNEIPKETDADRVRRLEIMVQQLLEQKASAPPQLLPTNPYRRTAHPLELDDQRASLLQPALQPVERLKMVPKTLMAVDENSEQEDPPQLIESSPRQKHPLDD
jgi:hypothetical protein